METLVLILFLVGGICLTAGGIMLFSGGRGYTAAGPLPGGLIDPALTSRGGARKAFSRYFSFIAGAGFWVLIAGIICCGAAVLVSHIFDV